MNKIATIILLAVLATASVDARKQKTLVILHTNDTHSTVMPLNKNLADTMLADRGGFLRPAYQPDLGYSLFHEKRSQQNTDQAG